MLKFLDTLSQHLSHKRNPAALLAGGAATIAGLWLFNLSPAPFSQTVLLAKTGSGLLDLLPFYTSGEAYRNLSNLGEDGRSAYGLFLAVDYLFIAIYSMTSAWIISALVRRTPEAGSKLMRLNLVPLALGLCDFVENSCNLAQLLAFPAALHSVGTLAGIATLSKHCLTILVFGLMAYLALRAFRPAAKAN
ncbi:hypothetical protein [Litorivita sp. NS0012-18]|uniref:hypothetical protein n=1 Tax=Litorivita sp. NS0012-18 TaxID=3127655 RepID=UPI003109CE67